MRKIPQKLGNFRAGFTLIELLVTLAIIAVVTSVFLTNYYGGETQSNLINAAQNLVRDLRQAQSYSLGLTKYGSTTPAGGWGVYLNKASSSYVMFADVNANGLYDDGEADPALGARLTNFPENTSIRDMSEGYLMHVVFKPTSTPETIIYNTLSTSSVLCIDLSDDVNGLASAVRINSYGLISDFRLDGYTKLLLSMNGEEGSPVFNDSSCFNHQIESMGVVADTNVSKFGTASAYFAGSNNYLTLENSHRYNFGSGDFTIDFWLKTDDSPTVAFIASNRQACYDGSYGWSVYTNNGKASLQFNDGAVKDLITNIDISDNIWHHIAFVKSGSEVKAYVDGVEDGSGTGVGSLVATSYPLFFGNLEGCIGTYPYTGYLDEFRISKGVARWTTDFTPPTRAY